MKCSTAAILIAALSVSGLPAVAAPTSGPDIEAATHLTMKECLAMQAAKNDGATRADMKKACRWTMDENGTNNMSSTEKTRPVDSTPYGLLPGTVTAQPR